MQKLKINGMKPLSGELTVQGAKNSILPILSACVIVGSEIKLNRCPDLSDVRYTIKILESFGCKCQREGKSLIIDTRSLEGIKIPDELMSKMRSSVVFLGSMLARTGKCTLSMPGGDQLGDRPIDIHENALREMGAEIKDKNGHITCTCEGRLKGIPLRLSFPSVGATENIILAAVTADGETVISNAAREPEIVDLANFLNKCGAKITGAGSGEIVIKGVNKSSLHGCEYTIMPDRIVTVTYLCAAAASCGEVTLNGVQSNDIGVVLNVLEQAGCNIRKESDKIYLSTKNRLKAFGKIVTAPYPGFPTDAQAVVMACLAKSEGTIVFEENIFQKRCAHVKELNRMGADIEVHGREAVVKGVKRLSCANVVSHDLRGGAALCVAACGADGETFISNIEHIDRGYDSIENDLRKLGADIVRL